MKRINIFGGALCALLCVLVPFWMIALSAVDVITEEQLRYAAFPFSCGIMVLAVFLIWNIYREEIK